MFVMFFFFKQKTAYEMRISDWSSDVCSSDLKESHRRFRFRSAPDQLAQHVVQNPASLEVLHLVERIDAAQHLERVTRTIGALHIHGQHLARRDKIGRASCRERVCQYV